MTVIGCASGLQLGCAAPPHASAGHAGLRKPWCCVAKVPCHTAVTTVMLHTMARQVSQLMRSRHSLSGQAHCEQALTTCTPLSILLAAHSRQAHIRMQPAPGSSSRFGKHFSTLEQRPIGTSALQWWHRAPHRRACVTGYADAGAAAGLRQARNHGVVISGCAYRAVWVERPVSTASVRGCSPLCMESRQWSALRHNQEQVVSGVPTEARASLPHSRSTSVSTPNNTAAEPARSEMGMQAPPKERAGMTAHASAQLSNLSADPSKPPLLAHKSSGAGGGHNVNAQLRHNWCSS